MSKLTERFEKAVLLAIRLHSDQLRKGTDIPYASHLLAVASLVLEYGGDEDVAIAGLLHDAAEDQGGLQVLDRIREQFGDRVAEIVEACSDTFDVPKPPWQQRKEAYLKKISSKSDAARLVSAADKLHNCRAILSDYREFGESIWERFKGGRQGTLWYYRSLVTAFSQHGPARLAAELDQVVSALEGLAETPS